MVNEVTRAALVVLRDKNSGEVTHLHQISIIIQLVHSLLIIEPILHHSMLISSVLRTLLSIPALHVLQTLFFNL